MGKALTKSTIARIAELRSHGKSIPEIAQNLSISKATALKYASGISIAPEFHQEWFGKRGGSRRRSRRQAELASNEAAHDIRANTFKKIFLALLYWAEGSKNDFNFMNSDPEMVRLFVNLLRSELQISSDRFRLHLRLYPGMEKETCEKFWSQVLELPLSCFGNPEIVEGRTVGKIKFGMCRVRVKKGGYLLKYLRGLYTLLPQYLYPHSSTDRAEVS